MADLDKNNNLTSHKKTNGDTNSKRNERDFNVPLVLVDTKRNPPVTFHRGNFLGKGGFAKVYQVKEESTGLIYADKVINKAVFAKKKNTKAKVEREITLHSKMRHENVIMFHGFFEDSNYVHMLLELAPQKTLLHVSKYRKVITEYEVKYYVKQIILGTEYIHSMKVLHRDLKLGNMFLSSNMVVKIGDFGLATSFADNKPGNLCGTPNYIAPEVLDKAGHSTSSEVWSIGCMVYALLCGSPPFETESVTSTYQLISLCQYKLPSRLSLHAVEFIQAMLTKEPSLRGHLSETSSNSPSLQSHPFLVEGVIPASLPCSALHTTPVYHSVSNQTGVATDIPTNESSDEQSSHFLLVGTCLTRKDIFLNRVTKAISECLAKSNKSSVEEPEFVKVAPVFISKWVDYSNKFGFGFQLLDGSVGVRFNDTTKIGIAPLTDIVEFTDMKGKTFSFSWDDGSKQPFPELNHRVALLKYYIQYMDEKLADSVIVQSGMDTIKTGQKTSMPSLERWSRKEHYVTMELNNNMVQVNHMEENVKVVIWEFCGEMLTTLIRNTISQTFSLASICPGDIRVQLEDTLQQVKDLAVGVAKEREDIEL